MGWNNTAPAYACHGVTFTFTTYGLDDPGFESQQMQTIFLFYKTLWDSPSLLFNGYRDYFTVVKWPGREVVRHGSAIIVTDSSVITEILLLF
jgi:hypothetical protein